MYNTDLPKRADLPTSAQLWRSTILAAVSATAILILVVLPSEYGIDPTGVGGTLGLTTMGEIKQQLAEEAAQDAVAASQTASDDQTNSAINDELLSRVARIEAMLLMQTRQQPAMAAVEPEQAPAEERFEEAVAIPEPVAAASPELAAPPAASQWRDETSFTLTPGEGAEFKLVMDAGGRATYAWSTDGAVVNFDAHGDGGGESISYEKGRGVTEDEGVLEAAFTGNHGWFWRNRTDAELSVTLRTGGDYYELKRLQ